MERSGTSQAISAAFVKAQPRVHVAIKNAVNPHLKNRYADLGAVWDAVETCLQENGLAVMQLPGESINGCMHMETLLLHSSGEWFSKQMSMPMTKQDPQGYGSALTYARRYALAALFGVTQDDDDGARATASKADDALLDAVSTLEGHENINDLKMAFGSAFTALKASTSHQKALTTAYNLKKKDFENAPS